jgi:hypothetical protein
MAEQLLKGPARDKDAIERVAGWFLGYGPMPPMSALLDIMRGD